MVEYSHDCRNRLCWKYISHSVCCIWIRKGQCTNVYFNSVLPELLTPLLPLLCALLPYLFAFDLGEMYCIDGSLQTVGASYVCALTCEPLPDDELWQFTVLMVQVSGRLEGFVVQ